MSSCPRVLVDLQGDGTRQRHGEPCRVPVPHHLLVNLKSFTYNSIGEDTDIFFSLYDLREAKTIRWERTDTLQVMMSVKAAVRDSGPASPETQNQVSILVLLVSSHVS